MPTTPAIKIRAYRGGKRSSVYREHIVSGEVFGGILNVAREQLLPVLSSIDQHTARELNKSDARQLADEVTRLRERAELPGLDEDLTALAEVARWCARASGEAWLTIEGR